MSSATYKAQPPSQKPYYNPLYEKPNSSIGTFFWRWRIWFESTFAFSMLENWEKIMLLILICLSTILVITGLVKYLPEHVITMQRRAAYYIFGQERDERLLSQWLGSFRSTNTKEL